MFDEYNILFDIGLNFIPLITCEFDKYIDFLAFKVYHYIIILFPLPIFLMFIRLICSSSLSVLNVLLSF